MAWTSFIACRKTDNLHEILNAGNSGSSLFAGSWISSTLLPSLAMENRQGKDELVEAAAEPKEMEESCSQLLVETQLQSNGGPVVGLGGE